MFNKFNEETKKIIVLGKEEMLDLNHPYLGSEHIVLGILKTDNNISNLLKKYNINYLIYKNEIKRIIGVGNKRERWILYTPVVKEIFERAIEISNEEKSDVTIDNIFVALLELGDCIASRIFKSLNVNIDKIYTDLLFKTSKKSKKKKTILDDIGVEYTSRNISSTFDPVIGRENEILQIIEILERKNKSNPLLIGEAGVGKTAIIEEISRLIVNNKVPVKLRNKRIISIDMSSTVAGTKYRGEFEEKLNKIIEEAENDEDIILFIDEIHTIVGAGGAEGAIDASNIFKPALARGNIKCIGSTTMEEYKKFIEKDKALARRFKTVIIEEPSIDKVKDIIFKIRPVYEKYHKVNISDEVLNQIIVLSNKYIHKYNNPDKTIDVLDEVCAYSSIKDNYYIKEYDKLSIELENLISKRKDMILNNNFKKALDIKKKENIIMARLNELELYLSTNHCTDVTLDDLKHVLKNKVNTPIIELNDNINVDKIIKKLQSVVIDQDKSIDILVKSYFYNMDKNECFSVLLNGPSGVGKTSLAREFAKVIGSKVLHLDMSEYVDPSSINKLLGAPPGYVGYDNNEVLLDKIREFPYTTIILDEIEKASKEVINLFFQILDNSSIKDSKGNSINFNNSIIIMTSNIKSNNNLGFNNSKINDNLNQFFSIPFINRIKEVISLSYLSKNSIIKIIRKNSKSKYIDNELLNKVLSESNYKEYGARQVKNVINRTIFDKKMKKNDKNYSKN